MGTEETNRPKLAAPARRALEGAGYTRLEDLTKVTESDVMKLHGMGANAMGCSATPWPSAACPSAMDEQPTQGEKGSLEPTVRTRNLKGDTRRPSGVCWRLCAASYADC
jgi:hypothetical protein